MRALRIRRLGGDAALNHDDILPATEEAGAERRKANGRSRSTIEADMSVHVFGVSAGLVGVCLTVVGIIRIGINLKPVSIPSPTKSSLLTPCASWHRPCWRTPRCGRRSESERSGSRATPTACSSRAWPPCVWPVPSSPSRSSDACDRHRWAQSESELATQRKGPGTVTNAGSSRAGLRCQASPPYLPTSRIEEAHCAPIPQG